DGRRRQQQGEERLDAAPTLTEPAGLISPTRPTPWPTNKSMDSISPLASQFGAGAVRRNGEGLAKKRPDWTAKFTINATLDARLSRAGYSEGAGGSRAGPRAGSSYQRGPRAAFRRTPPSTPAGCNRDPRISRGTPATRYGSGTLVLPGGRDSPA